MIYGANGYTGQLVARTAVSRGERPLLAGRDGAAVAALAQQLGLPHVSVSLRDSDSLRRALDGVDVVAHCAGPFAQTADPMVEACLATGTHYLDVTGEVSVFEAVFARHDEAARAGVVLLPGSGFDVVPTDCLAAMLGAALPTATSLELAFLAAGGASPGTFKTGLHGLAEGNLRRVNGELVRTPIGEPRRIVPFPSGNKEVGAVRWGDVVTAYRSTGIQTITVYTRLPRPRRGVSRAGEVALRALLRYPPTKAMATSFASRSIAGPDASRRARTGTEFWGEVRDPSGQTRTATVTGPNGYDLTADAVVRAVGHVRAGQGPAGVITPGAHTPSTALGADFVRELDGVVVSEVAAGTARS